MRNIVFQFVAIVLINVINAQYEFETIWVDDMLNNDNDDWVCGRDENVGSNLGWCDFGEKSSRCPNGDSNYCHRVRGGNTWMIRTTPIAEYSTLRFKFDVNSESLENGDYCELYICYAGTSECDNDNLWTQIWELATSTNQLGVSVSLPAPSGASEIQIGLEVYADGEDNADRCSYDNAELEGIKITSDPTLLPTITPTKTPTFKPTEAPRTPGSPSRAPSYPTAIPTSSPSKYPTSNPSKYPSTYPSKYPSKYPSTYPSKYPSKYPTSNPSKSPIPRPTNMPSNMPTNMPVTDGHVVVPESTIGSGKSQNNSEQNGYEYIFILFSIIGGLLFIIVILLIICYRKKKNHQKQNNNNMELTQITETSPTSSKGKLTTKGEVDQIKLISWLNNISLMEYYDIFVENGFSDGKDLIIALSHTTNDDLKEMGINKVAHRKLILYQIEQDQQLNMEKKQNDEVQEFEAADEGATKKTIGGGDDNRHSLSDSDLYQANKKTIGDDVDANSSDSDLYQANGAFITTKDAAVSKQNIFMADDAPSSDSDQPQTTGVTVSKPTEN